MQTHKLYNYRYSKLSSNLASSYYSGIFYVYVLFLKSAGTIDASMPGFTGTSSSVDSEVRICSFLPDIEILIPYNGCSQFEHLWHCV